MSCEKIMPQIKVEDLQRATVGNVAVFQKKKSAEALCEICDDWPHECWASMATKSKANSSPGRPVFHVPVPELSRYFMRGVCDALI